MAAVTAIEPAESIGRETRVPAISVETSSDAWTTYVRDNDEATGYHEWEWRGVLERAFGCEPIYFVARRGTRVAGVLPTVFMNSWLFGRSLVSLPFLNYAGVLADDAVAGEALLEDAVRVARDKRCTHIELRHVDRQFSTIPCKRHKVTMLLGLKDPTELWDGLDRKARNQVRKAQKSGLHYATGGVELLQQFYSVFARNMRDLGTPVYHRRFFEEILSAFPTRARLHVVSKDGVAIAAGLTFQTRGTVEIPWASSNRDFNALCPNYLLYWSILEAAAARGVATFDFGRSTPHEGTYKFKEQWGAAPVELCWEYALLEREAVPNQSPTNPKFKLAIETWKKLPLPVATRVGPWISRSIP